MAKKRNCRMTDTEKQIHERAVSTRKMTDQQLCEFIDRQYSDGMNEGLKIAETSCNDETVGCHEIHARDFLTYLSDHVGTGNRIGKGVILHLNRELEKVEASELIEEV